MARNMEHPLLATPTPDEQRRQAFVLQLKQLLAREIRPAARRAYEAKVKPTLLETLGREPANGNEVAAVAGATAEYRQFSALNRAAQEMMWEAVTEPLVREAPRLSAEFRTRHAAARGTLTLDAHFVPPATMARVHVHLQPGGYTLDRGAEDVLAGAIYEGGGVLYSQGQGVGTRESKAEVVRRFLAEHHAQLQPLRILDMGCGIGSSTTPYALAFPEAEVHGIDIGPGLLRYAHARAESMGIAVHFRTANATRTPFADGSFDLVVSHNAMHEMPAGDVRAMFAESCRLLRQGGVCVHQDVPFKLDAYDAYQQFDFCWDQRYNNEPHWVEYATADTAAGLAAAGFDTADIWAGRYAQLDNSFAWYLLSGRKPA